VYYWNSVFPIGVEQMRRGQLFLIEVIIALSIMIILITALFTLQNFSSPTSNTNLDERGNNIIDSLVDDGLLFEYLEQANYSYYIVGSNIFDPQNTTKIEVYNSILAGIPTIANFKAFTERYSKTDNAWERIDIVNYELDLPTGSDIYTVEYYTPGFNGMYDQYKFTLNLWYEVDA
jgi:hypothetical protein